MRRWEVRCAWVTFVALAGAMAPSSIAFAAPTAEARARVDELKKKGDDAMDALRADEALEAYSQAFQLSNNPVFLYNRGRALQLLGRFPESLAELEAFAQAASPELKARVPRLNELIAEVRSKVCVVNVHANVDGARVVVRNQVVGNTPLADGVRIVAGHATVEISREGYSTFTRDYELPGGGSVVIEATLLATASAGELIVHAEPADAVVSIDGKVLGRSPVEEMVEAGTHAIAVSRDGYESTKSSAVIATGEKKDVTISLVKTPPLIAKWWFWTGVGVVVAGGVAVIIATHTDKSVPSSSLGNMTAPLVKF